MVQAFSLSSEGVTPMLTKTLLIMAVLCAAILVGCSKTDDNSNSMAGNSNKATSTTGTTAAGDKIGVPECDDFIAKYDACVSSKVPEAARAQYKSAIDQWRSSWKKLADNPQTKGTLAAACKQAADQQAAALKTYGCTF
jgi:curli biogenesis system outer membrane secretion channel CsgG